MTLYSLLSIAARHSSNDWTRPPLCGVHLDGGAAIASDGRTLLHLPEPVDQKRTLAFTPACWTGGRTIAIRKVARLGKKRGDLIEDGQFPAWKPLFPSQDSYWRQSFLFRLPELMDLLRPHFEACPAVFTYGTARQVRVNGLVFCLPDLWRCLETMRKLKVKQGTIFSAPPPGFPDRQVMIRGVRKDGDVSILLMQVEPSAQPIPSFEV